MESFFDYKVCTHGEAVSKGVIFDLELSLLRGKIDTKYLEKAKNIFKLFDIDTDLIYLPGDKFIPLMRKDKKILLIRLLQSYWIVKGIYLKQKFKKMKL